MTEQPTTTKPYDPRPVPSLLLLSLPRGIDKISALQAMARAVRQTHTLLHENIEKAIKAIESADSRDDDYWWGSLAAYSESQNLLVTEICEQFDLHDQFDACELPTEALTCFGVPPIRPRLPAPNADVPVLDEVLDALYAKRDHLASLAASFNDEARSHKEEDSNDLYLLNRGMSLAYATACDLVEQALARIIGLDLAAFTAFLDEYGTNRSAYQ